MSRIIEPIQKTSTRNIMLQVSQAIIIHAFFFLNFRMLSIACVHMHEKPKPTYE